jgi:hypothetical protein
MKYTIGDLTFTTKKQCEEYTRNKINSLGVCVVPKNHPDYAFFVSLLNNHSEYIEKVGCGIASFKIGLSPWNRKVFQTEIIRNDGTEDIFSWVHCCEFKKRAKDFNLSQAMRYSIRDTISEFRQRYDSLKCAFCNVDETMCDSFHIDHHEPSFKTLKADFLMARNDIPTTFGDCLLYNNAIFKEDDNNFKNEWMDYHNTNCNLQVLCQKCNLQKAK